MSLTAITTTNSSIFLFFFLSLISLFPFKGLNGSQLGPSFVKGLTQALDARPKTYKLISKAHKKLKIH